MSKRTPLKPPKWLQRFAGGIGVVLQKLWFTKVQRIELDDSIHKIPPETPIVIVSNHVTSADSWLLLDYVTFRLKRLFLLMAAAITVKLFPIVRLFGSVSVGADPLGTAKSFNYLKRIKRSKVAVVVFPQGRHMTIDELPNAVFTDGASALIKELLPCAVVPVGLYYYSFRMPFNSVKICVGSAKFIDKPITTDELYDEVMKCVDYARQDTVDTAYKTILYPGQPVIPYKTRDGQVRK